MASNPASELVSAIQSVSIKETPSVEHDLNPSTAASQKIPADVVRPSSTTHIQSRHHKHTRSSSQASIASTSQSATTTPSLSSDILRPRPRRRTLPPFPDFRFEQSYLASVKNAKSNYEVAYITFKDQVLWPLISGVAYNLIMFGWRHWNRDVKLRGQGLGARVRRWWWNVNNWKMPPQADLAKEAEEVSVKFYTGFLRGFDPAWG